MNAHALARAGSPFAATQIRTDRDNEYDAFTRVTRRLKAADPSGRDAAAGEAVHMNTQLWSALASDLALPDNALPDELKAQLLSLALFSVRHGFRVAAGDGDLSALIEINSSIMAGLRGPVRG